MAGRVGEVSPLACGQTDRVDTAGLTLAATLELLTAGGEPISDVPRRAVGGRETGHPLGIRGYCPIFLPSPHPLPGRPFPPDVTDNRVLNDLDVQSYDALFGAALKTHRAAIGLPPVDNVRAHILTEAPWLAADPTLGLWQEPADLDVQTGAWILPDGRPLPAELEAFLDAGTPPVYVGFGSMRAPKDVARVAAVVRHGGAHERSPWPARSAPTGRRCCSTRSAEKGRRCPREPCGIVEPGKVLDKRWTIKNRRAVHNSMENRRI